MIIRPSTGVAFITIVTVVGTAIWGFQVIKEQFLIGEIFFAVGLTFLTVIALISISASMWDVCYELKMEEKWRKNEEKDTL